MIDSRLPTIPEYFKQYVDPSIDLAVTSNIPCPFHGEKHGKSFSYKADGNIWSCFGACHVFGADVITLHKMNYKFHTREEAEDSLYALYGLVKNTTPTFKKEDVVANQEDVHRRRMLSRSLSLATTPDDWMELDFIVSQVPYNVKDLERFCASKGFDV